MRIIIDGKDIDAKEGSSILDTALDAGIYIPHLCKHPDLAPVGGCRLCVVEVEGEENAIPSCHTEIKEGMVVKVRSELADKTRNMALELILASHPADCTGCPKYGNCELQSIYQYLGVSPDNWKLKSRTVPNDTSNPLIQHSFTRCIRCGRCIRACRELRGVKVLDFQRTKNGVKVGIPEGMTLEEAGCRFCGACIEVCPTGAITDAVNMMTEGKSYADSVVPCRAACPAHTDVPRYVRYIKNGEFDKATAVIREKVPFPEVLGSICDHVCESNCKKNEFENPISICKLKKAASSQHDDSWKERARRSTPTGKKVAIIGAGPAGMTSAYFLAKKGHDVTVFEENERAGGQCSYGIPAYRLPNEIIDREIQDIIDEGVKLVTETKIETPKELLNDYNAVLISIGTHKGNKIPLEGHDLDGVLINTDFLKSIRKNEKVEIKDKVMILGGGNVAYDCARSAVRLGAKEVHIVCLENLDQMTATEEEKEEGREEGIILHDGYSFLKIVGNEKVEGVEIQKINSFDFIDGKPSIDLVEGSNEIIPVDNVIFSIGQKPKGTEKMDVELINGLYIKTNESTATNVDGVFATGDVVTGTKSVIEAIEGGRKSATSIDLYLGGDGDISETLIDKEKGNPFIGRIDDFNKKERVSIKKLDSDTRKTSFACIEKTLSTEEASCEAERCLQCDLRLDLKKTKLWNEF